MSNLVKIILSLIVLGIALYFLGSIKPVGWALAIIGTIVGALGLIAADVSWGHFIDDTL